VSEGGVSTTELGTEIDKHHHKHVEEETQHDWVIAVIEAALLALVALLAAWSGYSSAKWSTQSRLKLAQASTARTEAANNELAALSQRNFDSSTFETWFTAWVIGDPEKEAVAERRFTPNFRRAFDAWMATDPLTNPDAPPGPTYMPEYKQPRAALAQIQTERSGTLFDQGSTDGTYSDDYVRATVYLATVLFLVALSGHFRIRNVRIFMIAVSVLVLALAVTDLATLPLAPG